MSSVNVYLKGGVTTATNNTSNIQSVKNTIIPTENNFQQIAVAKSIAVGTMLAQNSLQYITSNTGKWMGSQRAQDKVNFFQQGLTLTSMALFSPSTAIGAATFSLTTSIIDYNWEQKYDKKRVQQDLTIAGYNNYNEILGVKR